MVARTLAELLGEMQSDVAQIKRRLSVRGTPFELPPRLGVGGQQVTDWNDATWDGFYWGSGAANSPVPLLGTVTYFVGITETLMGNDGTARIRQTLHRPDVALSPRYERTFNAGATGVWSPWRVFENGAGATTSLNTIDLDVITEPGTYYQLSLTNGTLARHYPVDSGTGILEVLVANADTPTSKQIVQRFTLRGDRDNRVFTRAYNPTASTWQAWVELSSNSHYHVYQSSAQSIPASAWTSVGWNATAYKAGDIAWDGGTRVFTIPQSGVYQITAAIRYVAQTTTVGQRILSLLVNGTDRLEGLAGNTYGNGVSAGATLAESGFYPAGTTIAIQTYQSSGGALNTIGGQQYTRCQIDRLS